MTVTPDATISTLVVDDEVLARNLISSLVRREPGLMLIGESGDGAAALDTVESARPDLVFLDIQMPVMGGLAVAERLAGTEYLPYIIFVTAFDEYAIRAFELNALDYLVKPIEKDRFRAAVARARRAIRDREMVALTERLFQLNRMTRGEQRPPGDGLQELTVRSGDSIIQLTTDDVIWIEAANQYVHIHTGTRTYTVSESLGQYSKRINDPRFFRVHRSAIVNGAAVAGISRQRNGTHLLRLRNGQTLVLARSRASMVPGILRAARLAAADA